MLSRSRIEVGTKRHTVNHKIVSLRVIRHLKLNLHSEITKITPLRDGPEVQHQQWG